MYYVKVPKLVISYQFLNVFKYYFRQNTKYISYYATMTHIFHIFMKLNGYVLGKGYALHILISNSAPVPQTTNIICKND